ncbi:hypothetical protein J8J42_02550 [Chryseobacterium sp. cx-311]|uniref:DUF5712 family protein n=1 Tax=Marnyiella aurantia TaxID=2758037 RepID=UPI001AE3DFFE|nr:DUF5712 family protein [Marnyiella aurantia]MBP0611924.1 hypothetical protein [Marnyiella aurantia]
MHISFTKHNPDLSQSCKNVAEYLGKENYGREQIIEAYFQELEELSGNSFDENLERQNLFFSSGKEDEEIYLSQEEATDLIDNNSSSRHRQTQSNFFILNVSPSKDELDHLEAVSERELKNRGFGEKERQVLSSTERGKMQIDMMKNDLMHQMLREYAKDVMKDYAENFERKVYLNPDNLPSQKEEKIINEETKKELTNLGIQAGDKDYDEKFQRIREEKARDLGRDLRTRALTDQDLAWVGKIEQERTYKANDKWVMNNRKSEKDIARIQQHTALSSKQKEEQTEKIRSRMHRDGVTGEIVREGMKKGGKQYHIHIIVSRYDNCPNRRYKGSISPLANHRKSKMANKNTVVGFNRDRFFSKTEESFDRKFLYDRRPANSYESYKEKKSERNRMHSTASSGRNYTRKTGQALIQPLLEESKRNTGVNEISKLNMLNNISQELGFRIPMSVPKTPMETAVRIIRMATEKLQDASRGF